MFLSMVSTTFSVERYQRMTPVKVPPVPYAVDGGNLAEIWIPKVP